MTIPPGPCLCVAIRLKWEALGTSLVVQWLGLHAFTAKGVGSIPDWGTKIWPPKKKEGGIVTVVKSLKSGARLQGSKTVYLLL